MFLTLISFIFVFTILALAHEFGHYYFSVRAGIRVYEFGIGFGPKIFSFKRGNTIFSLNAVPFLAFVRIAGADTEGNSKDDEFCPESEKFYNKGLLERFLSLVAGPLSNLLVAFIVLSVIFIFIGVPSSVSNSIDVVQKGSEAERVGLKSGDKIISINGERFESMELIIEKIHNSPGEELSLGIIRNDKQLEIKATPQYNERLKIGLIGFSPKAIYKPVNLFVAIFYGAEQVFAVSLMTIIILGQLLTGKISIMQLAGPVGIAHISGQYAHSGFLALMHFLAFLNINIGILNLLPLPALDGGRIVFLLIEAIIRKPINPSVENRIHQVGLAILLAILSLVTINDILRIFKS